MTKDHLKRVSELADDLQKLNRDEPDKTATVKIKSFIDRNLKDVAISDLEEVLKAYKEKARLISQELIPSIFDEVGLAEIKLENGKKIIVEQKLKTNISDKNTAKAFENMIKKEMDISGESYEKAKEKISSLFDLSITIDEPTDKIKQDLIKKNIAYNQNMGIHYQTLNAYCKGLLSSGQTLPEGITSFSYNETKIKK